MPIPGNDCPPHRRWDYPAGRADVERLGARSEYDSREGAVTGVSANLFGSHHNAIDRLVSPAAVPLQSLEIGED